MTQSTTILTITALFFGTVIITNITHEVRAAQRREAATITVSEVADHPDNLDLRQRAHLKAFYSVHTPHAPILMVQDLKPGQYATAEQEAQIAAIFNTEK